MHIQLAEDQRSGSLKSLYYLRIFGRSPIGKNPARSRCQNTRSIDIVLDRDRDTEKPAKSSAFHYSIFRGLSLFKGQLWCYRDERVQLLV